MQVIVATKADRSRWLEMRRQLWDDTDDFIHLREIDAMLSNPKFITFIAQTVEAETVGFLEASVREDIQEGCVVSQIGYIEGWFVQTEHRGKGYGKALLQEAETWSKNKGLIAMGSDTNLENTLSQTVHTALGFKEVDRLVLFRKTLK